MQGSVVCRCGRVCRRGAHTDGIVCEGEGVENWYVREDKISGDGKLEVPDSIQWSCCGWSKL